MAKNIFHLYIRVCLTDKMAIYSELSRRMFFFGFMCTNVATIHGAFFQTDENTERHKVRIYKEYHSVALRRNWDSPPTPFSPASVPLPPETGGRGHTSLRVGGWVGSPNSDEGLHCGTLYMYVLCAERPSLVVANTLYSISASSFYK
jgi:hypothetical protein